MLHSILLFIPLVTAFFNRYWRGEGRVPKWQWVGMMCFLAGFLCGFKAGALFLLVLLGYAIGPWQAMFSALNGNPPGHEDGWRFQWMQKLALRWAGMTEPNANYNAARWKRFGVIYGAIRGSLTLPGVIAMAVVMHSFAPLFGVLFLGMGLVYYAGGKIAEHFNQNSMAIAISEALMGWWLGTYLLICSGL